jgi:ethanolamine utilization protein EutA (predicted chaperonin)
VLALPASLPVRYAALLTVIDALLAFVARYPNPHPLLVVAEQDFAGPGHAVTPTVTATPAGGHR